MLSNFKPLCVNNKSLIVHTLTFSLTAEINVYKNYNKNINFSKSKLNLLRNYHTHSTFTYDIVQLYIPWPLMALKYAMHIYTRVKKTHHSTFIHNFGNKWPVRSKFFQC